MVEHIYKSIELTGSSAVGVEDAVNNALARAAKTIHNLKWFEVINVRGDIEKNSVAHWQVTLKAGFRLDE
jgi:flavin-binding protein dodecin